MALALKPFASLRTGLIAGPGRVFQYSVVGGEEEVSIADMGWQRWQIYRWDGLGWRGSYNTAEEALAALEKDHVS